MFLQLLKQLRKYLMHSSSFFSVETKKQKETPTPQNPNKPKHTKEPHQTQTKLGESKLGI